jgi:hypothetical protein
VIDTGGLSPDEQQLLNHVPEDGATVGNQAVLKKLKWSKEEDRYWTARDGLVQKGLVVRGRGRGGTLRRVNASEGLEDESSDAIAAKEIAEQTVRAYEQEQELYEPIERVLRGDWAKDHQSKPVAIEVVARQGRRATGGTWSRPDLVLVEVKNYLHLPSKILDVRTFEVKPSAAISVQAVYEALAHRRASTHAYVVLHVPQDLADTLSDEVLEVRDAARPHGVGVITIEDPGDYSTWEEVEEALRVEPDPERLDRFLKTQLSPDVRSRLIAELR